MKICLVTRPLVNIGDMRQIELIRMGHLYFGAADAAQLLRVYAVLFRRSFVLRVATIYMVAWSLISTEAAP